MRQSAAQHVPLQDQIVGLAGLALTGALVMVIASACSHTRAARPLTDPALERVTMTKGQELFPTVTPDGSQLLYVADCRCRTGVPASQINALDLPTRSASRELVRYPNTSVYSPSYVPSLDAMLYVWHHGGDSIDIVMGSLSGVGGQNCRVRGTRYDYEVVASPEGTHIAFAQWLDNPLDQELFEDDSRAEYPGRRLEGLLPEELPTLWMMDFASAEKQIVATGYNPCFSPDGRQLAYVADDEMGNSQVWAYSLTDHTITQLTSRPGHAIEPTFSPDGRQVAYSADWSGNWDIWMVDRENAVQAQLTSDEYSDVHPTWANDGTLYFASDRAGDFDIWAIRSIVAVPIR